MQNFNQTLGMGFRLITELREGCLSQLLESDREMEISLLSWTVVSKQRQQWAIVVKLGLRVRNLYCSEWWVRTLQPRWLQSLRVWAFPHLCRQEYRRLQKPWWWGWQDSVVMGRSWILLPAFRSLKVFVL